MRLSISALLLAAAIAPVSMSSRKKRCNCLVRGMEWNEFGRAKKWVGWAWDWGRGIRWKILKRRMSYRIGEL